MKKVYEVCWILLAPEMMVVLVSRQFDYIKEERKEL
jgi:hypothetical protein